MKANNTIHINGKVYDARTGELVSSSQPTPKRDPEASTSHKTVEKKTVATTNITPKRRGNGFVDGIARHPNASVHKKPTAAKIKPQDETKKVRQPSIGHSNIKATFKPKHSQTLHRSAVSKPRLDVPHTPTAKTVHQKTSRPSQQRVDRALMTPRSESIHKFNSHTASVSPLKKAADQSSAESNLSITNIAQAAEKARESKKSHHTKHELIAKTLAEANAHAHAKTKTRKKHSIKPVGLHFAAGGLAALVLVGYVAYLNVPSLSMKVASSRAGFAASLPQSPSGYSMKGPIAYSPGQVIINFGSNTDERRFSIAQQPTTWDSAALKENYVAKASSSEPITYQDRGLTIYIYNDGDAAWINGGKFYNIKATNAQLDTKQILDIATSM